MKVRGTGRTTLAKRIRDAAALTGRDRLVGGSQALGFPLKVRRAKPCAPRAAASGGPSICFWYKNSGIAARCSAKRASLGQLQAVLRLGRSTARISPMVAAGPLVIITTRSEQHRLIHVVGHHHHGRLRRSWRRSPISSSCSAARVSASRAPKGFVHQQDLGLHRKARGRCRPLLHAAGDLLG